jgi:zinc transport system substrate-binding protein
VAQEVAHKPIFAASINPIYQILREILEDKNAARLIIDPSFDEHEYNLKSSDLRALKEARLVFFVDKNFEKKIAKIADKNFYELSHSASVQLVAARPNLQKLDIHFWLSPENALKIAQFMTQKLCEVEQGSCEIFQKNLAQFEKRLAAVNAKIASKIAPFGEKNFVFFRDEFHYFENSFALTPQKIMLFEGVNNLATKDLKELDILAKSQKISCIFDEKRSEKNSAQKLAKNYQIRLQVLDIIGSRDSSYFSILENLANDFVSCFNS